MIKRLLFCIMIFLAGMAVMGNLIILLETNPDYQADWLNVILGFVVFGFASYKLTYWKEKHESKNSQY